MCMTEPDPRGRSTSWDLSWWRKKQPQPQPRVNGVPPEVRSIHTEPVNMTFLQIGSLQVVSSEEATVEAGGPPTQCSWTLGSGSREGAAPRQAERGVMRARAPEGLALAPGLREEAPGNGCSRSRGCAHTAESCCLTVPQPGHPDRSPGAAFPSGGSGDGSLAFSSSRRTAVCPRPWLGPPSVCPAGHGASPGCRFCPLLPLVRVLGITAAHDVPSRGGWFVAVWPCSQAPAACTWASLGATVAGRQATFQKVKASRLRRVVTGEVHKASESLARALQC